METRPDESGLVIDTNDNIYKLFKYNSIGKISDVYIFSGGVNEYLNPESGESEDLFNRIFSKTQIEYIKIEKVNIHYSSLLIHSDDSIQTVKKKFIMEYGIQSVSYDEIYMFSKIYKTIQIDDIVNYQEIQPKEFVQFLENFNVPLETINLIEKKDVYTISDIIKLNIINSQKTIIDTCLGQRFIDEPEYLFSGNPFKLTCASPVELVSFENQLLINYKNFVNNEIYICLADDVFTYFSDSNSITPGYLSTTYYPFLYNSGIIDKKTLLISKSSLTVQGESFISEYNKQNYSVIDTFRKIYHQRKSELPYLSKGICAISLFIKRRENVQISLENLFKLIHVSGDTPLILYNPGFKKDSIIRLYCKKVSTNGKKIPVLTETTIHKTVKEINKSNRMVSYCVSSGFPVYVSIDSNSNIFINGVSPKELSVEEWDDILNSIVNVFIDNVNKILNYTGYSIPHINGLHDETIHSADLQYSLSISIKKDLSLLSKFPCLTTIFDVENDELSSGKMKYKRVENYKEMDELQTFIRVSINKLKTPHEIVELLTERFGIDRGNAIDTYTRYLDEHQQIMGKQIDNPGFNVETSIIPIEKTLVINVYNITNVKYVKELFIYLDSLVRVIRFPTTTHVSMELVDTICKKKISEIGDAEKFVKQNVISSIDVQLKPSTQLHPILYKDANLVVDEEEEEEEEEDAGFIIDYDYEYDEEEEVVSEDDEDDEGGGSPRVVGGDNNDINLNNVRIKNPSYFFSRIKKREPQLILSKKDGKYDAYARSCPANLNKQPVILTDEEKRVIDETSPGSYNHALRYGTDKNNPFWYICPRYWCLKTNTSMTKEQVESGICGGIIPKNAKTVPNGKYVYEFTSSKHIDSEGNYIEHTPGFLKEDSHPKYLLPCCFSRSWDSQTQKQRRDLYNSTIEDNVEEPEQSADTATATATAKRPGSNSLYIISFDVYPLPKQRWGFLPTSAQKFLEINYSSIVHNTHYIKSNSPCFLRFGVENTNTQSFISCISELYAYKWGLSVSPGIAEMKKILTESITLDGYIKYHNGSLVSIFRPSVVEIENVDLTQYSSTKFFATIDLADAVQLDFLENTVASFENFKNFLISEQTTIDHTYLWDIVTDNNPKLIKGGCNLVILNVPNDDITDNIEMVCPSNSYSSSKYNVSLETFILIKQEEFYEPIFMYEERKNVVNYKKTFLYDSSPHTILRLLEIIEKTTDKYCSPVTLKKHKMYKFVKNINAGELIEKLDNNGYTVYKQVLNYQAKTIGFVVGKTNIITYSGKKDLINNTIFLPCLPSAVSPFIETTYMDDPDIWRDYSTTLSMFKQINTESDEEILCGVKCKIVDDGIVVGVLTETNQFVQISPPIILEETLNDGLEIILNSNYNDVDIATATTNAVDTQRETEIAKISMESSFYYSFRIMVRELLNRYDHIDLRNKILLMLVSPKQSYKAKLNTVKNIIKIMISQTVVFGEFDMSYINDIVRIKNSNLDLNSGINPDNKYCFLQFVPGKSSSQLIVPKLNLVSGLDNENMYILRVSDEIIRYNRIQLFMFNPTIYLNASKVYYSINDDEFLVLQPLMTGEYFKGLIEYNTSENIKNLVYETADPQNLNIENYKAVVDLDEQRQMSSVEFTKIQLDGNAECVSDVRKIIGNKQNSVWARIFPPNVSEIIFKPSPFCSFEIVIRILQQYTNIKVTIQIVKQYLCDVYNKYIPAYGDKIIKILNAQGKRDISKRLKASVTNIEAVVFSDDYYLTDLDLWMIFEGSKIPVIIFYSTKCKTMVLNTNWIFLNGGGMIDTIYTPIHFIRSPVNITSNHPYSYHLISEPLRFRELGEFSAEVEKAIEERTSSGAEWSLNIQSLDNFLQKINFIKTK
jgi:hypothetical protein